MLCREQVAQLRDALAEIRALGAELVAVGSGTPQQAAWFVEDQHADFPVLTDPTRQAFAALEFRRGIASTMGPRAALRFARAFARGFRQPPGAPKGDALQQGGVLIVLPGGEVRWRHTSEVAGDHPEQRAVIDALRAAVGH
jgi:hypothetical protein